MRPLGQHSQGIPLHPFLPVSVQPYHFPATTAEVKQLSALPVQIPF